MAKIKTTKIVCLIWLMIVSPYFTFGQQLIPQYKIDSLQILIDQDDISDKKRVRILNKLARFNFYNREFLIGFEALIAARELAKEINYIEGSIMYHTSLAAFLGQHHIYEYHIDIAAALRKQLQIDENFDQLHFPVGYPLEQDSSLIKPLTLVRDHFKQQEEFEIEAVIIDVLLWANFQEGNYEQCCEGNLRLIELYSKIGEQYPVFLQYTYLSYIVEYTDCVEMDWLKVEFASFLETVTDRETMGRLYLHIGNFFRNSGQSQKAIKYYLNGSDYYASINDQEMLGRLYRSLGELYFRLEMYPQYAEIVEKRIAILSDLRRTSELHEEQEKAVWAMFNANRFEEARAYIDTLRAKSTQLNQEILIGNKNDLEGQILMKDGEFESAIPFLLDALEIYQKVDHASFIPLINMHLAKCYYNLGNLDLALEYALVSYNDPENVSGGDRYAKAINFLLSVLYDAKGNQIQAYQHLKEYNNLISEKSNGSNEVFETLISSTVEKSQRDIERLEQEKLQEESQNKIQRLWIFSISGGLISAVILAMVLYRNNKNKQKANAILKEQKEEIQTTLDKLESTQSQLIHAEKMASLGELTAGIAHEIQNPLNFVNNFSEVNDELIEELREAVANNDQKEIQAILEDLKENESKIKHHGQRAEGIVKSMLEHSRRSHGEKETTDINALADEYLRLAYHGMRAKDKSFNAEFKTDLDPNLPKVIVVTQDIGRVLLNLINNAFQAVSSKALSAEQAGLAKEGNGYSPEVIVSTKKSDNTIEIRISDNGPGIPDEVKDKIFQPFFTTKPAGQGTGLGLSLSYDIVKAHGGNITVDSQPDIGAAFNMIIPIRK